MKEFVLKLEHLHNIYPNPKLSLDIRLTKRWVVQLYTPEFKLSREESGTEFYITGDNRLIVKSTLWSFDFGFNLLGFGVGLSRKTDKLLKEDAKHIKQNLANIGVE